MRVARTDGTGTAVVDIGRSRRGGWRGRAPQHPPQPVAPTIARTAPATPPRSRARARPCKLQFGEERNYKLERFVMARIRTRGVLLRKIWTFATMTGITVMKKSALKALTKPLNGQKISLRMVKILKARMIPTKRKDSSISAKSSEQPMRRPSKANR